MVFFRAPALFALSLWLDVQAVRDTFDQVAPPKHNKIRNAKKAAWAQLPTRIRCGQLKATVPLPVQCESNDQVLHLYGNTVSDACVRRSRDALKSLAHPTGSSCEGGSKLSSTRTAVDFFGRPYLPHLLFCCLCPPNAVWSRLTQECVCPTIGDVALAAVNGRCASSADQLAAGPPPRRQIQQATSECKLHREFEELAPAAKYRLAPIRQRLGMEVPSVGVLTGVIFETFHVSKLNAELKFENSPHGIKVSLSPGGDRESWRVGVDKVVMYLDGEPIRMQHADVPNADGSGGKYLFEVGGTLEGEDLLQNLITYRTGAGFTSKQTFFNMANMKSNNFAAQQLLRLPIFKSYVEEAIKDYVANTVCQEMFVLMGWAAQELAMKWVQILGIDPLPIAVKLDSKPTNPLARHMLNLNVAIIQGRIRNFDDGVTPEVSPGFPVPEVTANFATEGEDLLFDVSAGITFDTIRLLEKLADDWNSAVLADAVDGKLYSDILEEQRAANESAADSHRTGTDILGAMVSSTATFLVSFFVEPPSVQEPIPTDPSKERSAMEEYLLQTWRAQKPKSIGTMSRVPQDGNPYYLMYGLDDIEFVTEGILKAAVQASGDALLAGTLTLSKFVVNGLAVDMVEPLPCHTRQDCNAEQATWRPFSPVLARESLRTISVQTPLPISVAATVRNGVVNLTATVAEHVAVVSGSSWINQLANTISNIQSLKGRIEDLIAMSLKSVVTPVFARLRGKGSSDFTLDMTLDSAKASRIDINGMSRYSSLGDFQLLAAAVPPESLLEDGPEEVLPGQGWAALKARLDQAPNVSGAAVEKYSLEPKDWLGLSWAFSVNELLDGVDLNVHLDPSRPEFLVHVAGSVSLDIPAVIRASGKNEQGSLDFGGHAVGLGRATLLSGEGRPSAAYDSAVSCGTIYFADAGQSGDIVYRADRRLSAWIKGAVSAELAGTGAESNYLQVGGHSCPEGTAYVVKPSTGKRSESKWCVATHSLLNRAIVYEFERARLIEGMLVQRPYAASAPWDAYVTVKTAAFDWSYHMSLDLCRKEMQRCAAHIPCQGVQLNDARACEFLSFSEVVRLKATPSANFAHKQWQVGPVQSWGAEASGLPDAHIS